MSTEIIVDDYFSHYGGAPILIDGRECTICSVVGYALYNKECPVDAVTDTLRKMKEQPYNGHKLVWVTLSGVVISSDPGFYARQEEKRAKMPQLKTGDLVRFEGHHYIIAPDHNRNFKLIPA